MLYFLDPPPLLTSKVIPMQIRHLMSLIDTPQGVIMCFGETIQSHDPLKCKILLHSLALSQNIRHLRTMLQSLRGYNLCCKNCIVNVLQPPLFGVIPSVQGTQRLILFSMPGPNTWKQLLTSLRTRSYSKSQMFNTFPVPSNLLTF